MMASIDLAHAGGTTGEWAGALRQVWGEYRAPTGLGGHRRTNAAAAGAGPRRPAGNEPPDATLPARSQPASDGTDPARRDLDLARERILALAGKRGGPPRLLVAKPGLDGHSNGAEQIAVAARDAGFEVVYQGIRQTPEQIAAVARDEDVDVVGLSILSGSHMNLVEDVRDRLRVAGVDVPLVVGGIIPPEDEARLLAAGWRPSTRRRITSWGRSWPTWPIWLPPASTPRFLPADWLLARDRAA